MKKKYFGTDGIRGRVGTEKIHPEFIMKLGWALGRVLNQTEHKKVIVGKDTRISGYMFESALEAGFSAAGVDVRLIGPMPTPAIAYLTQTFRANAGVVISASHNPYQDNGIKFFDANGEKLPDELELAIEEEMAKPFELKEPHLLGKASRITDANGRYIEFCKSTISSKLRLNGLKIVLDCANGATYKVAPSVFKELGAQVIVIGDKPDGLNINHNCGSTHPEQLQAKVLACQADLGIGFDGDGDRVIMVDSKGHLVNGDGVLYLIATDRHEQNRLQGGVVGTLMTNMALEVKFKELNIPFVRTNVGDRYVMSELKTNKWLIGGETSGHIVCLDKTTTGDGIIAALQVLAKMVREHKSLAELMSEIHFYPQVMLNVKTNNAAQLMQRPDVLQIIEKHEKELQGRGRMLVRPSGTEPLLRILLEGPDEAELLERKKDIENVVNQIKEKV
jgi:phosphoglucosamine mutase